MNPVYFQQFSKNFVPILMLLPSQYQITFNFEFVGDNLKSDYEFVAQLRKMALIFDMLRIHFERTKASLDIAVSID